eukprot:TRINITY_DN18729_c0_g1_i1.p1 TRINITY_DN18729_c0_g1~~TRINITY_DN18729_c0_g1_i1.p1  ORF type:complete len:587 (+),score=185.47 TRINITY_DN18729_c0_g1_i1:121-1761(+)
MSRAGPGAKQRQGATGKQAPADKQGKGAPAAPPAGGKRSVQKAPRRPLTKQERLAEAKRRRERLELETKAAIVLQSAWRRFAAARKFHANLRLWRSLQSDLDARRQRAAWVIQQVWWVLRHRRRAREIQRAWEKRRRAALAIQCSYRQYRARIVFRQRQEEHRMRCIILLQAAWRALLARRIAAVLRCDLYERRLLQREEHRGRTSQERTERLARMEHEGVLSRTAVRAAQWRQEWDARHVQAAAEVRRAAEEIGQPPPPAIPFHVPVKRQPPIAPQGLCSVQLGHWVRDLRELSLGQPWDAVAERLLLQEITARRIAMSVRDRFLITARSDLLRSLAAVAPPATGRSRALVAHRPMEVALASSTRSSGSEGWLLPMLGPEDTLLLPAQDTLELRQAAAAAARRKRRRRGDAQAALLSGKPAAQLLLHGSVAADALAAENAAATVWPKLNHHYGAGPDSEVDAALLPLPPLPSAVQRRPLPPPRPPPPQHFLPSVATPCATPTLPPCAPPTPPPRMYRRQTPSGQWRGLSQFGAPALPAAAARAAD